MVSGLELTLLLLGSAVLGVVAFRMLHLPPMLGYLTVGILIGPHALGMAENDATTHALAEFGVVFLMFSIGLEFSLSQLMAMRRIVFGLGMAQVMLTIATTMLFGWLANIDVPAPVSMSPRNVGMTVFTLAAAGAAILFFGSREKIARLQMEAAQEKARAESVARQAMQAQLQLLQAQIEPHMLFNTLANLQGLISFDPDRAQLLLDQLIQYLRATLSSSRAGSTTLKQEFSLMQAYLGLMSTRMGARLRFTLDLPEALRDIKVPPMLLQPLVENAIQHGLEPKIEGGHIHVQASTDDGVLILTVADDGLGLDHPGQTKGTHLGVANIRERLRGMHGDAASLSLAANHPAGVVARLTLPLPPTITSPLA